MWGQGIYNHKKFVSTVAVQLARRFNREATLFHNAHSGAKIGDSVSSSFVWGGPLSRSETVSNSPGIEMLLTRQDQECPKANAAPDFRIDVQINRPLPSRASKSDVELVLMNGCTNDMWPDGVEKALVAAFHASRAVQPAALAVQFAIAFATSGASLALNLAAAFGIGSGALSLGSLAWAKTRINNKAKKYCYTQFSKQLKLARQTFPNARIAVLGYYPVQSMNIKSVKDQERSRPPRGWWWVLSPLHTKTRLLW